MAIAREKQIKRWRSKKIVLIEKMNSRWEDLAEHWGQKMLFRRQSMGKNSLTRLGRIHVLGVPRLRAHQQLR
jgi:hypothetical protein